MRHKKSKIQKKNIPETIEKTEAEDLANAD